MSDFPTINFAAAIGIGLVVGLVGVFLLRERRPERPWLAPVLAVAGALIASVLALIVGDQDDYGWKEPILQVVLAAGGVAVAAFLASKGPAPAEPPAPTEKPSEKSATENEPAGAE